LVKQYKVFILTRDVWCVPGKIAEPNIDIWYTDGSGISNPFGAGVCGPRGNHRDSIPMGSLSAVFQTEVMAIQRCAGLFLFKSIMRRIHICSLAGQQ
jgi:hypothetical protein